MSEPFISFQQGGDRQRKFVGGATKTKEMTSRLQTLTTSFIRQIIDRPQPPAAVLGAVYLNDCPRQRYIPIYLIVMGAFSLALALLSCLPCAQKPKDGSTNPLGPICATWNSLITCFLFFWFIAGNVWIYSIYKPNFDKSTTDVDPYCDMGLYVFAFWITTVVYIVIVCFGVIVGIMSIAQIVIGAMYQFDCPMQRYIPVYLLANGVVSLLLIAIIIPPCGAACFGDQSKGWACFWSLFLFCWFIAGAKYIHDCLNQPVALICMVVVGGSLLLFCCCRGVICNYVINFFFFFFLIIAGNACIVAIFKPKFSKYAEEDYCNETLYWFVCGGAVFSYFLLLTVSSGLCREQLPEDEDQDDTKYLVEV
ncbi:hypothetical protein GBF38_005363 [Nibea albiflora]|uniref:Uncharacterized protein n=1 Tax=Nibea albiflora TaxID=240163 RepID=A0ACB7EWW0_NIBAL|nr:hypothetical protein GBF38_005363 [Nibea albiflora]